jgi:DNA-binding winged helix-turn-helix (wHTH) protein
VGVVSGPFVGVEGFLGNFFGRPVALCPTMSSPARIFEFGEFQLNVSEQRLLRGGRPVALPPKAFELLVALVERGGQLVTRETLLKRGWPDTFVEAGSLSYNISLIRKALEDDHGHRTFIETVPKRGYRFVAARVIVPVQPAMSVLVLPFGWDQGDPVLEDVADGLAESLINTLSQLSRVRVIARVTAFTYKGQAVDVRRVADELRVSAVLTGRVARRSDAITAHVEIIDPSSMAQVWGETYRQPASDLLAAQQAIASGVAERLDVALGAIERLQLSRAQPADDPRS